MCPGSRNLGCAGLICGIASYLEALLLDALFMEGFELIAMQGKFPPDGGELGRASAKLGLGLAEQHGDAVGDGVYTCLREV